MKQSATAVTSKRPHGPASITSEFGSSPTWINQVLEKIVTTAVAESHSRVQPPHARQSSKKPLAAQLSVGLKSSLLDAIEKIESTRFQIVFVVDDHERLLGIITNGDLRRFFLSGGSMNAPLSACMNRSFRAARMDDSREQLLKLFDLGLGVVPRVDEEGRLIDLVTPSFELASPEAPVLARAKAPVRVSFGGGGSDLTYYFVEKKGLVLNATVALYSHATLVPRSDKELNLYSEDLQTHRHYKSLDALLASGPDDLLGAVVSVIKPTYGFDLYLRSDFTVGSGLGGSSAVATAIVAAFNELRLDRWSPYESVELAFQAERLCYGVAGGWQDQYASAFGGFNLIELDSQKNLVHAIRLEQPVISELEECLILCNTMIKHDSGDLHAKQKFSVCNEEKATHLEAMVALCKDMHQHLLRGELLSFGRCLDKSWRLKRGLSAMVSNDRLDGIYEAAIKTGAVGGKLLGAGAGGYFLFFVLPQHRTAVSNTLRGLGCTLTAFKLEPDGVQSWRTRLQ
jgi:D-glycero-alpha-D-manno-heptose-7-phosphate kinase